MNILFTLCLKLRVKLSLKYLGDVGMRGQADHDIQFLQFDIDGVIVLDKEHFDLLLQNLRPTSRERLRLSQNIYNC